MNKFTIVLSFLLLAGMGLNAQNNQGKADDGARIAISPQVSDQEIPNGAKNMLLTKMKQIATLNGLSGDGDNPFFIMDASVDILTKELTPTAPPMHALNLQITFFIGDNINDNVYSETSMEVKGVGKNETKAYIAAIKNINTRKGQFKAFVERGKDKILEFYNSDCDFVISRAKALQKQGNNAQAIKVLNSVPKVSKECYDKCMEILAEIEPPADEPVATADAGGSDGGAMPTPSADGKSIEIDDDIFLVYVGGKHMGDKTMLNFELQNRGVEDYELNDYNYDTRCIDGNGNEFKVEKVTVAGNSGARGVATLINGVPVNMECEFDKIGSIAMFEYKYKGRVYRLKNLTIGAVPANTGVQQGAATGGSPAAQPASISVGSKVFVEIKNDSRVERKVYSPGKVKTVASAATKNEYEVMAVGECSSDVIWTKDIITQWHQATKTNVKEGMLIIYATNAINETTCYKYGKVIAVDELYKNLITIKGSYWDDIIKVQPEKVLVVDKSVVIK